MSLKSIRDSVLSRFMPQPKQEAVDPVPLPAEEQQQIEVQEVNTGMVHNNYLMRDYLMSLPEEERQKYIDAQNGNPAIKEYKKTIGLKENIKAGYAEDFAPIQTLNEDWLTKIRAKEDSAWANWRSEQRKAIEAWSGYITALRQAYPNQEFYDSMPGWSPGFRKARAVFVNDDPFFREKYPPDLPKESVDSVTERAMKYGYAQNFPRVNPDNFPFEEDEVTAPDAGLNKYYCEPDEPTPKPTEDINEARKPGSLLRNK